MRKDIPRKFCYGDGPRADNVAELQKLLNDLPADLPIEQGFGKGVRLTVYNVDRERTHLSFDESDD